MKTCYSIEKNDFDIAWPERVSRHDLVYDAPPTDPMQYGIPLGNGEIGALLWCDERRIIISVNKSDLWDDASFGSFFNWSRDEEEFSTTLRHACRIIIDFGRPVFDTFYLKDFKARLNLKNGAATIVLDTPFGKVEAEIFVAYNLDILAARVKCDFVEEDRLEVTLERYGSRTFSHWYHIVRRDPDIGLHGTDSWTQNNDLFLSHTLTTGDFYCALSAEGEGLKARRRNSHTVVSSSDICPKEFTVFATVTSPFDKDGKALATETLAKAEKCGFDALLSENERCWHEFWDKSFIETDDDYLDNLWHLVMYYSNAGQRGRYPGRFINSMWNWNRDVQPWNFYFHWNQQEAYWGLNAAGHHELCDSYLNYRFNGMEHAKESAKEVFGVEDGLFVSDVCERRGYNSTAENDNHTPVCEIALDFWRQYLYTCDKEFLVEKALPYMLGAARFFATRFVKEADGKYHAIGGSAYEGIDVFYDPITELAMARVLFPAVLKALSEAGESVCDEALFRDISENVADIVLLDCDEDFVSDNTIKVGMFKGRCVNSDKVLALGRVYEKTGMRYPNEKRTNYFAEHQGEYIPQFVPAQSIPNTLYAGLDAVRAGLRGENVISDAPFEIERIISAHYQANVAPAYPMGLISVKDRGSELYEAQVTTALVARNEQFAGFDPMPVALARLGLADAVDKYIYEYPSVWQYYNNGFAHYGPNSTFVCDKSSPFRRVSLFDVENPTGEKFRGETFPFRHMGLEPHGVFSATMNERLMQSFDGTIRMNVAYGNKSARFKLHAVGGFEVMAEIKDGVCAFVAIRSLFGNPLTLENPWDKAYCNKGVYESDTIVMDTEKGKVYLFTPDGVENFEFEQEIPLENTTYKVRPDGNAMLGLARSF